MSRIFEGWHPVRVLYCIYLLPFVQNGPTKMSCVLFGCSLYQGDTFGRNDMHFLSLLILLFDFGFSWAMVPGMMRLVGRVLR